MKLTEILNEKMVEVQTNAGTKDEALARLVDLVTKDDKFMDRGLLLAELKSREKLGSTGIGEGVAIPHVHLKGIQGLHLALMTSSRDVDYDAIDDKPCRVFLIVVAPDDNRESYLRLLSEVSRLFCKEAIRNGVVSAKSPADLIKVLADAEATSC